MLLEKDESIRRFFRMLLEEVACAPPPAASAFCHLGHIKAGTPYVAR